MVKRPVRHGAVAAWLIMLAALALYCAWRTLSGPAFESNILGLVPDAVTPASPGELALGQQLERRFAVLVSAPDPALARHQAGELAAQIDADGVVTAATPGDRPARLAAFYKPFRHQLLTPQRRQQLFDLSPSQLARAALADLHNPMSGWRPFSVAEDPFNLGGDWLASLYRGAEGIRGGTVPSLSIGGTTWYLVAGTLRDSPFSLDSQIKVTTAVDELVAAHPDLRVLRSGVVFHAAEATALARREITTVGVGSVLAIALLVAATFRSRRSLLAIGFTLGSGLLWALGLSLVVFERVHLITVAFGATLLGLAVDYCFHFLARYHRLGDSRLAGRAIARGLVLSAGSSILAYLIQLFAPFGGLQQFAVFMAAGLAGAALAVGVLSLCYRDSRLNPPDFWTGLYSHHLAAGYVRLARTPRIVSAALILGAGALTLGAIAAGSRDDVRALNASSDSLLASEQRVRSLLGGMDPQRFYRVSADDPQTLLARTQRLQKALSGARAVTDLVPPLAQQRADYQLVKEKVYGEKGALAHLCRMLAMDCEPWSKLPAPFRTDLTLEQFPQYLKADFPTLLATDAGTTLVWPEQGTDPSSALAANRPGVTYVDRVAQLSDTLANYRQQVTKLLGVFLALFAIACLFFYGRAGIAILSSVFLALAVGLGAAAAGGITLFHMLALLLVMGLAVDTAVFYRELGLTGDTWLASSLAALTSVLAFGLLALSQVPVLHHFGSVVFAGLLCTWLATPLIFHLGGTTAPRPLTAKGIQSW